ncbi:cbb3-type cytochrome c oxidase subunit 3 [Diaphorobacter ruginosibacter]|jgi:cytochrome c oxidase cbb3-type subunit 4|uniref:Cbb3-type cytochrome c oxidase subunit 3 n=1 Tax=Diaphorobacter ruginosibacter TaxID=1715720 RepID=A0A7G9RKE8_9BURK|nr:cbb3-type cytochrome c oxidase subunit 3 [Diaphorobacter ruginosibacter]MDR2334666.1 cbb3-type cytochrome c oxidase subunit 3 [Burkholderiaceae bacterium]QNN56073.1 cbb3-type cytochrome c oxidase subunit 3 [Diaphorobacter ruginosibacter]
MDISTMRSLATVASLACFLGIWFWAFRRKNKTRFEEAAQLPFLED